MEIRIGDSYIDVKYKDVVKVIRIDKEEVAAELLRDPLRVWSDDYDLFIDRSCGDIVTIFVTDFESDYTPLTDLGNAIYE